MTYQYTLRDADGADLVVSDPVVVEAASHLGQLPGLGKLIFNEIAQACHGLTGTTLVLTLDLTEPAPEP